MRCVNIPAVIELPRTTTLNTISSLSLSLMRLIRCNKDSIRISFNLLRSLKNPASSSTSNRGRSFPERKVIWLRRMMFSTEEKLSCFQRWSQYGDDKTVGDSWWTSLSSSVVLSSRLKKEENKLAAAIKTRQTRIWNRRWWESCSFIISASSETVLVWIETKRSLPTFPFLTGDFCALASLA